jgi:alpha-galactosidase
MKFKTQIVFLILFAVKSLGSIAQAQFSIQSNDISITFDRNQNQNIQWLVAKENYILENIPDFQPAIVVNGILFSKFDMRKLPQNQKRIKDAEFGDGLEATIKGICKNKSIKLQRDIRIFMPDNFKNTVIVQTTYTNLGNNKLHIDSVYAQRLLLKSKDAKSAEQPADFVSFQGGIEGWGADYSKIWLTPGYYHDNAQGIHHTKGSEYMGPGMAFIDVWNKSMGVALMHIENKPIWLTLPVKVNSEGNTEMAIVEKPIEEYMMNAWLEPGDEFQTVTTALVFHHLDYYEALSTYGELLRCRGINIPKTSPPVAYEPYWKSWGFEWDFTLEKIYNTLPELRKMGIHTANLDDGWFEFYGDWNVNRSLGKFPNGESDMIDFVKRLHDEGFKTSLWWNPYGVSPLSVTGRTKRDLLVQAKDGSNPVDERGLYTLCPAYQPALDFVKDITARFIVKWGFDGLYDDTRTILGVPPCYNKLHHHASPLDSYQNAHKIEEVVDSVIQKNIPGGGAHEVCVCSAPHSPYIMPYFQMSGASDPVNNHQVRERIKAEKAIHSPFYSVGDCYQVPTDEWTGFSVKESFESAVGTGALVTTIYNSLDSNQMENWIKGVSKYRESGLSNQEYLNLYDIVFDYPEIHVVRKGNEMYYGIYADSTQIKHYDIELRGLDKKTNYSVYDYWNEKELGAINGNNPVLSIDFKEYLLIRLKPQENEGLR